MRRTVSTLFILVLFFFATAVFAGGEGEQDGSSLPGLVADGAVGAAEGVADASVAVAKGVAWTAEAAFRTTHYGVAKGFSATRYGLKEGACDGTRAAYDGAKWAAHQTPADYGRYAWRGMRWTGVNAGKQTAKTPGYVLDGLGWATGLW